MNAIRRHWKLLLQSGVWLLGVLGTLIVKPDLYEDTGDLAKLNRFVVIGILALFWVPMLLFKRRRNAWPWWTLAAVLFVMSIFSFGLSYLSLDLHTVRFQGHRTAVGTPEEIIPDVKVRLLEKYVTLPPLEELVEDAAGHTEAIWPSETLKRYRHQIYLYYLMTALLAALFVLAAGQAVVCLNT